jgi:hypothetical protein
MSDSAEVKLWSLHLTGWKATAFMLLMLFALVFLPGVVVGLNIGVHYR